MQYIVDPWKKVFIFFKKETVTGKIINGFQHINKRHMIAASGADGHDIYKYATDKELFEIKLTGDSWDELPPWD
jgi:hypothetical protein